MKICKSEDLSLEISVIEGKVLFSAQCPILFLYYIMIFIPPISSEDEVLVLGKEIA
jgi:hypothetical protein